MAGSYTLTVDPLFLDIDSTYGADDLGAMARDHGGEGVTTSSGLVVSERGAGANMSVDVAAGVAHILGDENTAAQPMYRARVSSTQNLAIDAADVTNPRIDRVVLEIDDTDFDSSGSKQGRLYVDTGTPAASPSPNAEPNNAITLALVNVAASDTAIQDAEVDDMRQPSCADASRVGFVEWFPLAAASLPWGYIAADGVDADRRRYLRLFARYGTTIGAGDGSTTFGIPNVVDRFAVGAGSTYSVRATGGAATHTLSEAELPSHTHADGTLAVASHSHSDGSLSVDSHSHGVGSLSVDNHSHGIQDRRNATAFGSFAYAMASATGTGGTGSTNSATATISGSTASASPGVSGSTGSTAPDVTGATASTGSGSAHNNLPPYYALTPAIRV